MCRYTLITHTCGCRTHNISEHCSKSRFNNNEPCPYKPCESQIATGVCAKKDCCTAAPQYVRTFCGFCEDHEVEKERRHWKRRTKGWRLEWERQRGIQRCAGWMDWKEMRTIDVKRQILKRNDADKKGQNLKGYNSASDSHDNNTDFGLLDVDGDDYSSEDYKFLVEDSETENGDDETQSGGAPVDIQGIFW